MVRGIPAIALVASMVLVAGCGGDDEGAATPARTGMSAAQMAGEGDSPAFAMVRGGDTLLVERYTLSGDRVSGVMRDPEGSAVEYETVYSRNGERTMRMTLVPADTANPRVTSTFTLRGDSAWLELTRGDSTVRQGDTIRAGALPYLSPSWGMMALVARKAREMVGDSGQVSLLAASLTQPPVVVQPLIVWRGDTAWVIGNQMNQFRLVFSGDDLISAENPPQQMRAIRLPAPSEQPAAAPGPEQQPPAQQP